MLGFSQHEGTLFFPTEGSEITFAVLAVKKVDYSLYKQNVWSLGIASMTKVQPWLHFLSTIS